MRYKIIFYTWLACIVIVSSIPNIGSEKDTLSGLDKIAHFSEYLILALLYILMKRAQTSRISLSNYFILAIILPLADEMHQILIPGRTVSFHDYAANWVGATTGFLIYYLLLRIRLIKP
jgi:VanZ family protein